MVEARNLRSKLIVQGFIRLGGSTRGRGVSSHVAHSIRFIIRLFHMNVYEMMYCHTEVCYSEMQYHQEIQRKWFSGKIQRCHRWAPGSIPGLRKFFVEFF